jgi:hypothetical protein
LCDEVPACLYSRIISFSGTSLIDPINNLDGGMGAHLSRLLFAARMAHSYSSDAVAAACLMGRVSRGPARADVPLSLPLCCCMPALPTPQQ